MGFMGIRSVLRLAVPSGVALSSLLVAAEAEAQMNYRDLPIGGRTAAMGGAGTAHGNDSAMPYINPAGVSAIPNDIFAISAQAYAISRRKVPKFFHPNGFRYPVDGGDESFSSDQMATFPTSIMYMTHVNDPHAKLHSVLAVSLVIPTAQKFSMTGSYKKGRPDVNGGVSETRSVTFDAADYYVGPTYSLGIGERFNVGVTLYALYTRSQLVVHEEKFDYEYGGTRLEQTNIGITEEHRGAALVPIVGAQYEPVKGLRMGAAAAIPSIRMYGHRHVLASQTEDGSFYEKDSSSLEAKSYAERPLRVNVGVSYEHTKSFAVAMDASYHAARDGAVGYDGVGRIHSFRDEDVTRDYKQRFHERDAVKAVINLSLGGEIWLGKKSALRAGLFTNNGPRKLDPTEPYGIEVDRKGISLGLGSVIGTFESSVALVYQHGKGRINVEDHTSDAARVTHLAGGDHLVPVAFTEDTLMLALSGVVTTDEAQAQIKKQADVTGAAPSMQIGPDAPAAPAPPAAPSTEQEVK
jgi:hypothetical protein